MSSLVPHKLWSDYDEEDDDGLPSPLSPLNGNSVIAMKREAHVTNAAEKLIMTPTVSVFSAGLSAEEPEKLQHVAMLARETANMGFLSAALHRSNEKPEDISAAADSAISHGSKDNPHVTHDTTSPEVASSISKVFSSGYKGTNSESCKEQVTPDIACVHTSSFYSKIACDIVTPSALSDTHVTSYVFGAQANTGIGTGVILGGDSVRLTRWWLLVVLLHRRWDLGQANELCIKVMLMLRRWRGHKIWQRPRTVQHFFRYFISFQIFFKFHPG